MFLDLLRLLLDFGLLVLIWIVQRIIYPSFLYVETEQLVKWHKTYTARFTFIVLPLMLGQLGISLYQLILETTLYSVSSFIIIVVLWLSTFLQFVPVHAKISKGNVTRDMLETLVKKNWIRTMLWTLLWAYSLFYTLN